MNRVGLQRHRKETFADFLGQKYFEVLWVQLEFFILIHYCVFKSTLSKLCAHFLNP